MLNANRAGRRKDGMFHYLYGDQGATGNVQR